jgi:hypothetical protein
MLYHLTKRLSAKQMQWATGDTGTVYKGWAKKKRLPIVVDELSEDARLFWIGKQNTDRVILYLHGKHHFSVVAPHLELVTTSLCRRGVSAPHARLCGYLLEIRSGRTQKEEHRFKCRNLEL